MKKRMIVVIGIIVLAFICSIVALATDAIPGVDFKEFFEKNRAIQTDDEVLVTVNGEKIYQSAVDFQLSFSELSYAVAVDQIEHMDISETEKQLLLQQQKDAQKTAKETLDDLIKEALLLQAAKREGIVVSDEEAHALASERYMALKNSALTSASFSDTTNYEFIRQYMEETGLTEEQYIDKAADAYKKLRMIDELYKAVLPSGNAEDVESEAQDYLNSLWTQAEIIYQR